MKVFKCFNCGKTFVRPQLVKDKTGFGGLNIPIHENSKGKKCKGSGQPPSPEGL